MPCGVDEKDGKTLAGEMLGTDSGHKKTHELLCQEYITPYRGIKTNAVSNGLLLRADIHTLFDLALMSIEPARMKIRVSSLLSKSQYAAFDGRVPALPRMLSIQPSLAALEEHYSQFHP